MAIAISFFSGAGGLDIGMYKAGFDIRLAVEIEEVYCNTLKNNFPNLNVKQGDIMDYSGEKVCKHAGLKGNDEIDLIIGGSPCQSFSTAGKRQAFSDKRGQAMLKFAEIVTELQPKAFVLENVRGLLSAALKHRPLDQRGKGYPPLEPEEERGSALKYLLDHFPDFNVKVELINAADYGVPQTRERVFIIGIRKDLGVEFELPEKTHDKKGENGRNKWVTLGEVLKSLNAEKHHYQNYSEERLYYMKMIPQGGGNWRDLPNEVVKKAMGGAYKSSGGRVGYFRRCSVNKPAPTLMASPAQKSTNLGHPYEDRPLSIEEYLAIQGFPSNFNLSGTLSQKYEQIGNAVPVRLARVIGEELINTIQAETIQEKRIVI